MNLTEANNTFDVCGLNAACLKDQQPAFELCRQFLAPIKKLETPNRSFSSYGLKHRIEEASRFRLGHHVYIYEGTLILAALSLGFEILQPGRHLKVHFNISERDLKVAVEP